jgi:phosphotransferase system HPr (HPr) family protein
MYEKTVVVRNLLGVHGRPMANIVRTANTFQSQIALELDGEKCDARDILEGITLGMTYGKAVRVIADGEDEEAAVEALCHLFEDKFDFEE